MLGSTVFASKCPQFKKNISGSYAMSPQPHETCCPKGVGLWFIKKDFEVYFWFEYVW